MVSCRLFIVEGQLLSVNDTKNETFKWLASNLHPNECAVLVSNLLQNNISNIESEDECVDALSAVLSNASDNESISLLMDELMAKNHTKLAKSLTNQDMKQEVNILKKFQIDFIVEDILNATTTNLTEKKAKEISQAELIVIIVTGSVYLSVLLTYLLLLCWSRLTFPPDEYLTTEYDLLIH
ncbi:hypothetical protein CHUAL_003133 [Chamberlinius hualienensis]